MPETYDQYRQRMIEHHGDKDKSTDIRTIRLAIQAETDADLLLQDKLWDPYIQSIQYALDQIKEGIAQCEDQLHDPRIVEQNLIMLIKIKLTGLIGQQAALAWVIELPHDIKKTGVAARKLNEDPIDS